MDRRALLSRIFIRGGLALGLGGCLWLGVALGVALAGEGWVRTGGPLGGLGYDIRIQPGHPEVMFVTDNPSGVNKSYDGGLTWHQRNQGIDIRTGPSQDVIPIFCLTVDPGNPQIIWAGTQGAKGVYKSTDTGETWTKMVNGIVEGDEISFRGFAIHPRDSQVVLAAAEITTNNLGIEFDKAKGKIYKTTDGGQHWRAVWEGGSLARVLIYDYSNPSVVYCSTGIFDREAANDRGHGVLKSTDGGETWFEINHGLGNLFVGFLEMDPGDPQVLYAAAGCYSANTGGGIYKTVNGGESWRMVLQNGISEEDGETMNVVTVSPSNPQVVYAGHVLAFFRSQDGGETWERFAKPEGGYGPEGIHPGIPISAVVHPFDPRTLFVNNYGGGNFVSRDGAATWQDCSSGYTGAHLHSIDLALGQAGPVYTVGRSGPFKSSDGGASWQGLATGEARNFSEWNYIAVNPADPQNILLSDEHWAAILYSDNGGQSWRKVFQHPDVDYSAIQQRQGFKRIAFAPGNPQIVYAGMAMERQVLDGAYPAAGAWGMFKSTDGGKHWQEINQGLGTQFMNVISLVVNPFNADEVFIGTWRDGVYRSRDGGASWGPVNNGLGGAEVRSLALDPHRPSVIYAGLGEGAGIYRSINAGDQWQSLTNGANGLALVCPSHVSSVGKARGISLQPPPFRRLNQYSDVAWTSIWDLAVDPSNSQVIYAADHGFGMYRSCNGGVSWELINQGLSTRAVTNLAISQDGRLLYAATEGEGVFRWGDLP